MFSVQSFGGDRLVPCLATAEQFVPASPNGETPGSFGAGLARSGSHGNRRAAGRYDPHRHAPALVDEAARAGSAHPLQRDRHGQLAVGTVMEAIVIHH